MNHPDPRDLLEEHRVLLLHAVNDVIDQLRGVQPPGPPPEHQAARADGDAHQARDAAQQKVGHPQSER